MKVKRWFKILGGLGLSLLSFLLIFTWLSAKYITHPPRAELTENHHSYLQQPADHGLRISKHFFSSEQVPTVIVRPHPESDPGKRGKLLRHQLHSESIALPPYGSEIGLLVMLHGRQARKEYLLPIAERYCAAGFICILPDLPAHGENKSQTLHYGSGDSEQDLPNHVVREAASLLDLDHLPKSLWGMSMGGSFAIHAAASQPETWHRIIIISSFDKLDGVISDRLEEHIGEATPILKPLLDWMVLKRNGLNISSVRPIEQISKITAPTLIVHGDADELIGKQRGQLLFQALKASKGYYNVPGADHGNIFITEAPVFATTTKWLLK